MAAIPAWKKYIPTIKDLVFIIGILVSSIGWIRASGVEKSEFKNQIKNLTEEVAGTNTQLEKINETLVVQSELNGKIIMFIDMYNK